MASMASVKPYQITVPDKRLDRLRAKLELTEFPDELEDAGWDYGAPLVDIKRLTAYWKDEFNWRKQEADINKLPQFQTQIEVDGFEQLNIHFIHQKSENPKAIPLLFVHGCRSLTSRWLQPDFSDAVQGLVISWKWSSCYRCSPNRMEARLQLSTSSRPLCPTMASPMASRSAGLP